MTVVMTVVFVVVLLKVNRDLFLDVDRLGNSNWDGNRLGDVHRVRLWDGYFHFHGVGDVLLNMNGVGTVDRVGDWNLNGVRTVDGDGDGDLDGVGDVLLNWVGDVLFNGDGVGTVDGHSDGHFHGVGDVLLNWVRYVLDYVDRVRTVDGVSNWHLHGVRAVNWDSDGVGGFLVDDNALNVSVSVTVIEIESRQSVAEAASVGRETATVGRKSTIIETTTISKSDSEDATLLCSLGLLLFLFFG